MSVVISLVNPVLVSAGLSVHVQKYLLLGFYKTSTGLDYVVSDTKTHTKISTIALETQLLSQRPLLEKEKEVLTKQNINPETVAASPITPVLALYDSNSVFRCYAPLKKADLSVLKSLRECYEPADNAEPVDLLPTILKSGVQIKSFVIPEFPVEINDGNVCYTTKLFRRYRIIGTEELTDTACKALANQLQPKIPKKNPVSSSSLSTLIANPPQSFEGLLSLIKVLLLQINNLEAQTHKTAEVKEITPANPFELQDLQSKLVATKEKVSKEKEKNAILEAKFNSTTEQKNNLEREVTRLSSEIKIAQDAKVTAEHQSEQLREEIKNLKATHAQNIKDLETEYNQSLYTQGLNHQEDLAIYAVQLRNSQAALEAANTDVVRLTGENQNLLLDIVKLTKEVEEHKSVVVRLTKEAEEHKNLVEHLTKEAEEHKNLVEEHQNLLEEHKSAVARLTKEAEEHKSLLEEHKSVVARLTKEAEEQKIKIESLKSEAAARTSELTTEHQEISETEVDRIVDLLRGVPDPLTPQAPDADQEQTQAPDADPEQTQVQDADQEQTQAPNADPERTQAPDADLERTQAQDADLERTQAQDADPEHTQLSGEESRPQPVLSPEQFLNPVEEEEEEKTKKRKHADHQEFPERSSAPSPKKPAVGSDSPKSTPPPKSTPSRKSDRNRKPKRYN